jgi:hypothetical protein
VFIPFSEGADVFLFYVAAVFGAEEVFEENAERIRKVFAGDALLVKGGEAEDFVFFVADFEGGAGVERV